MWLVRSRERRGLGRRTKSSVDCFSDAFMYCYTRTLSTVIQGFDVVHVELDRDEDVRVRMKCVGNATIFSRQ